MIGGRIAAAGGADGVIPRVVVRLVAGVKCAVLVGLLGVAALGVDQGQVVVRGDVFRINGQGPLEPHDRVG